MVAMGILATGLLGLAGVFTIGMAHMATSSANLIAREKAREAVESVHTARDTRTITWCQIYNVTDRSAECVRCAGAFLDGAQNLKDPGDDGLVNTADDGAIEAAVQPGPDGMLGTTDDVHVPMIELHADQVLIIEPDVRTTAPARSTRTCARSR